MNVFQKIVAYFRTAKAEMEKVSWPTRQETIRYSGLVIGLSVAIAAFFAALDFGLTSLVDATLTVRQEHLNTQNADVQVTPVTPDVVPTTAPTTSTEPAPIDVKDAKPIETPNL